MRAVAALRPNMGSWQTHCSSIGKGASSLEMIVGEGGAHEKNR